MVKLQKINEYQNSLENNAYLIRKRKYTINRNLKQLLERDSEKY